VADLAHTNRVSMMGELAASLAHEITQPVASARDNARAVQNMQPPDLGEVREALACGDFFFRRGARPAPRSARHRDQAAHVRGAQGVAVTGPSMSTCTSSATD
jgi:hypothetical protein